eukprot:TRINITY_DN2503_c1_g1_i1.p4 TRINITY_DN2503_c1_g1~~TRINITY_DN2503_c1_g1_i1.p4  ORF type:complete len:224 (-),score=-9.00 TRINITY_DN2503_c1_g1_i1:1968-2639(-)
MKILKVQKEKFIAKGIWETDDRKKYQKHINIFKKYQKYLYNRIRYRLQQTLKILQIQQPKKNPKDRQTQIKNILIKKENQRQALKYFQQKIYLTHHQRTQKQQYKYTQQFILLDVASILEKNHHNIRLKLQHKNDFTCSVREYKHLKNSSKCLYRNREVQYVILYCIFTNTQKYFLKTSMSLTNPKLATIRYESQRVRSTSYLAKFITSSQRTRLKKFVFNSQ